MDAIKKIITCGYCERFLTSPVILKCCSEKICQHHVSDFAIKNTNMMKCALCNKEQKQDENIFTLDKSLNEFIELKTTKSFIESFKKTAETYDRLKTNLNVYNHLKKNPKQFIESYFHIIKNKVDKAKNSLIRDVERMAEDIKIKIDYDKEVYSNYVLSVDDNDDDDDDVNNELAKIQNWSKIVNSLNKHEYETKGEEFENINKIILKKVEILKNKYLMDKSFDFYENSIIEDDLLGKYAAEKSGVFDLTSIYHNMINDDAKEKIKNVLFEFN
jgi:hypothetical protein